MIDMEERYRLLATILTDLDRCEHGRHAGDTCCSCRGPSLGNPHLRPGQTVGYDRGGRPYVMPDTFPALGARAGGLSTSDPQAWRPEPEETP